MHHTKQQPFFARFLEAQDLTSTAGGDPGNSHGKATNKNHSNDEISVTEKYPSDNDEYQTMKYPSDSEDA